MTQSECFECGAYIHQPERGRPRKFCTTCRPQKLARPKNGTCRSCGKPVAISSHSAADPICLPCIRITAKPKSSATGTCTGCGGPRWEDKRSVTTLCRACLPRGGGLVGAILHGNRGDIIDAVKAATTLDPDTGCWSWSGYRVNRYPIVRSTQIGRIRVHRLVMEVKLGRSIGDEPVHHICANRSCVNPDHLQLVTVAENNAEMLARRVYEARIAELEAALASIVPNHPVLRNAPSRIGRGAGVRKPR